MDLVKLMIFKLLHLVIDFSYLHNNKGDRGFILRITGHKSHNQAS